MSLHICLAALPSEDVHASIGRGGVRQTVVLGSTAPGTSGTPGIGVFLHSGMPERLAYHLQEANIMPLTTPMAMPTQDCNHSK